MAEPRKKTFSFGTCTIAKTSPARDKFSPDTRILNVAVTFENGLKLALAIDECLRRLNSYNRNTRAGRRSAMNIAIHLEQERITVNEQSL